MARVFLGIGTNLGNRKNNIRKAIKLLKENCLRVNKISKVIETEPVSGPPQRKFLNTVISIHTELPPFKLLLRLKKIERDLGRVADSPFRPRIIDLDILLYDDLVLNSRRLTIPHPRMWEREFVLKPLSSLISLNSLNKLKKASQIQKKNEGN